MVFETLKVSKEGAVLFVKIAAPPMNLLGPELVRDLVSLIQRAETDQAVKVLVFKSDDADYFISHVDVTKIKEYGAEAAKLTGDDKPFCWRTWEFDWTPSARGPVRLVARCTDDKGATQPEARDPDRRAYMINHLVPVEVMVR